MKRATFIDTVILVGFPIIITLGWCSLEGGPLSEDKPGYVQPTPISSDEPGMLLAPKGTVVITQPVVDFAAETNHAAEKVKQPVKSSLPAHTDWHDDINFDDREPLGSCGKRMCDCADTDETCEGDIDCCNGYDACIEGICSKYEDY